VERKDLVEKEAELNASWEFGKGKKFLELSNFLVI
jgi:hypothetical protein